MVPDDSRFLRSSSEQKVSEAVEENTDLQEFSDRGSAYQEFLKCLKKNKDKQLSAEEVTRLMKFAFLGSDLKYKS